MRKDTQEFEIKTRMDEFGSENATALTSILVRHGYDRTALGGWLSRNKHGMLTYYYVDADVPPSCFDLRQCLLYHHHTTNPILCCGWTRQDTLHCARKACVCDVCDDVNLMIF
jgi:hypothetical protein